jgi:hypothetical protein
MSLDAVISADLVKTRAEIAALSSALTAARNEISGLSNQINSSSALKSMQRLRVRPMPGSQLYADVAIGTVNPLKTLLLIRPETLYSDTTVYVDCELINATTLRCKHCYWSSSQWVTAGILDIQVVEFK